MKQTFKVLNVKCGGCASTLRTTLEEKFGDVRVDLMTEPREITLDIEEDQIPEMASMLKKVGYPLASEDMGFVESNTLKAKSFVSCAIGKFSQESLEENDK